MPSYLELEIQRRIFKITFFSYYVFFFFNQRKSTVFVLLGKKKRKKKIETKTQLYRQCTTESMFNLPLQLSAGFLEASRISAADTSLKVS